MADSKTSDKQHSQWGAHHDAEVRKHWEYLVNKYADMPPRTDTSHEIANVINDASNLAAGIRRYTLSATRETVIEQCITALDTHGLASIVTPDKALTVRQVLRSLYVNSPSPKAKP